MLYHPVLTLIFNTAVFVPEFFSEYRIALFGGGIADLAQHNIIALTVVDIVRYRDDITVILFCTGALVGALISARCSVFFISCRGRTFCRALLDGCAAIGCAVAAFLEQGLIAIVDAAAAARWAENINLCCPFGTTITAYRIVKFFQRTIQRLIQIFK